MNYTDKSVTHFSLYKLCLDIENLKADNLSLFKSSYLPAICDFYFLSS